MENEVEWDGLSGHVAECVFVSDKKSLRDTERRLHSPC